MASHMLIDGVVCLTFFLLTSRIFLKQNFNGLYPKLTERVYLKHLKVQGIFDQKKKIKKES